MNTCFHLLILHLLLVHTFAHVLSNRDGPPLPTSPPTLPTAQLKDNPSCLILGEALAICGSLTTNFKDLDPSSQAQCLCYSSTAWVPSLFDSAVKSCAAFASESATSAYSALANIENFCTSIGDVARPASNTAITTSATPTIAVPSACSAMTSMESVCAMYSPGFATMDNVGRAKCLCYPTVSSWAPTAFDDAVDSCNQVAKTAAPGIFATASALEGFCAGIGDVIRGLSGSSATVPPSNGSLPSTAVGPLSPTGGAAIPTSIDPSILSEITVIPVPIATPSLASPSSTTTTFSSSHTTVTTPTHTPTSSKEQQNLSTAAANRVITQVPKIEVIVVSLVCASVMFFLC